MNTIRTPKISLGVFSTLIFSAFFLCAHAQLWSGIIPSSRAVDWTQVGIPGGIPARAQCGSTIVAGASQSTIQTALNNCASAHPVTSKSPSDGGFVLLGPGTFTVDTLSIPNNVTLRGSGANQTILSETGSSTAVISMVGTEPNISSATQITSGATAGSQSLTVASNSGFVVGGIMVVTQPNTGAVTNVGSGGSCTWCDGWTDQSGPMNQGQIVQITSINGTTIGFTPALFNTLSNSPVAVVTRTTPREYAGVENLQLYANNTGHTYNIWMDSCAYCWADGVEGNYVDGNGDQAAISFGFRDQISNSYFSDGYQHTSGATENEILLAYKTSNSLIQNNILERLQTAVDVGYGSAGNVIAYNYMEGGFDQSSALLGGTGTTYTHGAHPEFNLFEGNVMPSMYSDSVWGSSQYLTFFRNWAKGTGFTCAPATGRGVVNCSGSSGVWQTEAARSGEIDGLSTDDNFIGNVLGSAEQSALGLTLATKALWPTTRSWDTVAYGWTFGYTSIGDSGSNSLDSTTAYDTALFNGNYDNIDKSLTWGSGTPQSLPPSFYLNAKPAWWRSNVAWPAIGPDVTTGNGPGGHTYLTSSNSAMDCFYNVMGGSDGGAGGPYNFNASTCYGSSTTTGSQLSAPTGLTGVVQTGP